jgi:hypothetical protein
LGKLASVVFQGGFVSNYHLLNELRAASPWTAS